MVQQAALAVVGELVAEGGQHQPGGRDGLDGVVVDLPGDAAPLLLLGPHDPPEQPAALLVQADQPLVGQVALGDVAQHHHLAGDPAAAVGQGGGGQLVAAAGQLHLLGQDRVVGPLDQRRLDLQELLDLAPDGPGGWHAQGPLGRRVELDHPPVGVEHQGRVQHRLEHRGAGGRGQVEQPEAEQPPDQDGPGEHEQEGGRLDEAERPQVEVVGQVGHAGQEHGHDQEQALAPVAPRHPGQGPHEQAGGAPQDQAGVDQERPEQGTDLGDGPGRVGGRLGPVVADQVVVAGTASRVTVARGTTARAAMVHRFTHCGRPVYCITKA